MSKFEQFLALSQSLPFFGFLMAGGVVTGILALATNIYREPKGWKTGVMSGIAFLMGAAGAIYAM